MTRDNPLTAQHRQGFSRVEVLVCVVVFLVATTLLAKLMLSAREQSRQSECKNNLKQIGIALANYSATFEAFPCGSIGNTELPVQDRWSWYIALFGFGDSLPRPEIDFNKSWDDPELRPLQLKMWKFPDEEWYMKLCPPLRLKCPNDTTKTHGDGQVFADYLGTGGLSAKGPALPATSPQAGAWSWVEARTQPAFVDGLANTMHVLETGSDNDCWLAGGLATVRPYLKPNQPIGPGRQFGGLHPGLCMTLYADGRVDYLADTTDPGVFTAIMTLAGSEPAPQGIRHPR